MRINCLINGFPGLLIIAIAVFNTACGFQLRDSVLVPEELLPVYVEQNTAFELARELKSILARNKIPVVNSPAEANASLRLLRENRTRRVLTVDSNGRAREYLLLYTVNIAISVQQAEEIHDSVSTSRSLLFDPEAVLATANETEILYADMRKMAARLILQKMRAYAVKHQLVVDTDSPDSDPDEQQENFRDASESDSRQ